MDTRRGPSEPCCTLLPGRGSAYDPWQDRVTHLHTSTLVRGKDLQGVFFDRSRDLGKVNLLGYLTEIVDRHGRVGR